jgi:hypothetical protein
MEHLLNVLPPGSNVSEARKRPETLPEEGDSEVSRYLYQTPASIHAGGPALRYFAGGRP